MNHFLILLASLGLAGSVQAANEPAKSTSTKATEPKLASQKTEKKTPEKKTPKPKAFPKNVTSLIKEDLTIGTGQLAEKGKRIEVHYTGWIYNPKAKDGRGAQFDSSVGGQPFQFALGAGQVIKGWDEGFDGMKEKGKRRLIIPSKMAYGERGAGAVIKPNQDLMFEVELLKVVTK